MKHSGFIKNKKIAFILFVFLLMGGQFQLLSQNKKSKFPLVPGNVVYHTPASHGVYVGAPSIAIKPDGEYVVSLNFTSIKNGDLGQIHKTAVLSSADKGKSWKLQTEIENLRWATIFYHKNALYLIGVYEAFGNVTIRKSLDGGKTWTEPSDKKNGLLATGRYHCAPVPIVISKGRIWRAIEDAPKGREFRAIMMSAPVDSDLMDADNWSFSNKLAYDKKWYQGKMTGWLEGNAVLTNEGNMVNILRCSFNDGTSGVAAKVEINNITQATFSPENNFVNFPGGTKKFTIRYDKTSKKYWSLVNWIQPADMKYLDDSKADRIRNTLALTSSTNLKDWIIERVVLYHPDIYLHAFQYVDWLIDGNDIIAVSRTAFDDGVGGASNYHNANFITFHRVKAFRDNFNLP
jgi:hypothetical protein